MEGEYVFLAISPGGVVVDREYLVKADEVTFDEHFRQFKAKNHPRFVTFLTRQELVFHLNELQRRQHLPDTV